VAVDASDVNTCTGYVVEFPSIRTTNTAVGTSINESTSLASVIVQRYMVTDVGHINAVLGR
jgi:hypothetical protein